MEGFFKNRYVIVLGKNGLAFGKVAALDGSARTATLVDCRYFVTDEVLIKKAKAKGIRVGSHALSISGPDKYVKRVLPPLEFVLVTDISYMHACTESAVKAWLGRPTLVSE